MANAPVIAAVKGEGSSDAVELATVLGELLDAPLIVASVFHEDRGEEAKLLERGGEVRALIDSDVPRALQQLAQRESAAVLVVGSSSRGRLGRVFPGRTADRLTQRAPCAVAVAPRGYAARRVETVGCAFNPTDESRAALALSAKLAERAGARLQVLTCTEPPFVTPVAGLTYVSLMERKLGDAKRRTQKVIAELVPDASADVVALGGDPGDAIAARSGEFDLLVCGTRSCGQVRALVMGNASRRLIGSAQCPVVVTPKAADSAHLSASGAEATP